MERHSAFSPKYESRSPFSPNYIGRSAFARSFEGDMKKTNTTRRDEEEILREIRQRNAAILENIKSNFESYKKNKNEKAKKKAFEVIEMKIQEMYSNLRNIDISLEGYYTDPRKDIIKDLKSAQSRLEELK